MPSADSVDWISIGMSLVAVIVGSGIAFLTTWLFEKKKRKDEIHGLSYSLAFKCHAIAEEVAKYHLLVKNQPKASYHDGSPAPVWMNVPKPVGFAPEPVTFDPAELALVARTKNIQLLQRLTEAASIHRILKQRMAIIYLT